MLHDWIMNIVCHINLLHNLERTEVANLKSIKLEEVDFSCYLA